MSSTFGFDSDSYQYVYVGIKGKCHIRFAGATKTVCDRDVPENPRTALYSPAVCAQCAKDTNAVISAENQRKKFYDAVEDIHNDQLSRERAGHFKVFRCKRCGMQHHKPPPGSGVPFCMTTHHVAELEEIDAQGPPWV